MERIAKVLVISTMFLVLFASDVQGGRHIKDRVDHPQTFLPGIPSPGFTGSFPSPGFTGTFPSPGFSGVFPSPGFSGTFPSPGLFCSFPGVRCPALPANPGGALGGSP